MRIGCFTPLLSQFPLEKVFEKLRTLNISTVELGTGNYPGDPHCKLSMLSDKTALKDFKQKFADNGFTISALSSHGNSLHPDRDVAKRFRKPAATPSAWRKSSMFRWWSIFRAAPAIAIRRNIRIG